MTTMLLALHVAGGSAALLSMFVPLLSRKGGAAHRRGGWVFVAGMTVVSATAFVMSAIRFLTDPSPQGRQFSAFLFFVGILTAANVSTGVRVLRAKARTGRHRSAWDLGLSATLLASSVPAFAFGLLWGNHFFTAFSVVGALTGAGQLAYWLRPPTHRMHWWFEHMGSMLGACIAATTAFLVTGGPRLGLVDGSSLLVWLAPTLVGVPGIVAWVIYYKRRFNSVRGVRLEPDLAISALPLALILLALGVAPAGAQGLDHGHEGEAFEVASIKPAPGPRVPAPQLLPGGVFQISGVTLNDLVRLAYPTANGQVMVENAPGWVTTDRFDVMAKAATGARPSAAMLRSLLIDRFKLRARLERRQGTVFELMLARKDGRLGPSLTKADCGADDGPPPATPEEGLARRMAPADPATSRPCQSLIRIGGGPTLFGEGIVVADLARTLSYFPVVAAPVIDRTGLTGRYDFRMQYRGDNNPNPDAGPLVWTALQEQLGLKLERTSGTIDVVVIDAVEKLEAN